MSAADGTVVGITKIRDAGTPGTRWNLVFLSDGYQAAQLGQFATAAQSIVDALLATAPFDRPEIQCGINVYRIDVTSTDQGADKPACTADGPATPQARATYFDSTFCFDGDTQRLVYGNDSLARTTVEALLPEWDQIIVVVNDSERGGGGGQVAWTTIGGSDWREVAIHELGHSVFGLADEYDYGGADVYPDPEPPEPNVTVDSNPATCKWSALVTAGPGNPTRANPNCGSTDPGPAPSGVGTFEGADYSHCGVYRPVWTCRMRQTSQPFCPVCTGVIVDTMTEYAQPAPSGDVTLATATVDFNDVPAGLSVVRAARFDVASCLPVTFQAMTTPTAPFALESPAILPAPVAGLSPWPARFWFRFTAGAVGSVAPQQVTLRCLETAENFTVTLVANVIARPTVAAQLVFDKSSSMLETTDEGRTKEQVLKDSASSFADLLWDDNGVGINAYDQDPHPVMDVAVAGAPGGGGGRDAALAAIAAHASNPSGLTAIGDGIELARDKLNAAAGTWDAKAMVVLTDGIETASKYIAEVADGVVDSRVFAIGMGTAEQIQPAALDALTSGTGGYLLMTGNIGPDETFLLEKYYLQILAGVNNVDVVVDPEGVAFPGQVERIPFDVTESDVEITAMILGRPADLLAMALETPDGQLVGQGNASLTGRTTARTTFMRAGLPLLAGGAPAHAGRWNLLLTVHGRYAGKLAEVPAWSGSPDVSVRYSASVAAWSNLRMAASLYQSSREPGATLALTAVLTEYGAPFLGHGTVRVEMTRPDGSRVTVPLLAVPGEPGRFTASRAATQAGIYSCRFLASGRTAREEPFTREQIRTAAFWHGGDNPGTGTFPGGPGGGSGGGGNGGGGSGGGGSGGGSGGGGSGGGGSGGGGSGGGGSGGGGNGGGGSGGGGNGHGFPGGGGTGDVPGWCSLVACLLSSGAIDDKVIARLREAGVDVGRLRRCLEAACTPREGGGHGGGSGGGCSCGCGCGGHKDRGPRC